MALGQFHTVMGIERIDCHTIGKGCSRSTGFAAVLPKDGVCSAKLACGMVVNDAC